MQKVWRVPSNPHTSTPIAKDNRLHPSSFRGDRWFGFFKVWQAGMKFQNPGPAKIAKPFRKEYQGDTSMQAKSGGFHVPGRNGLSGYQSAGIMLGFSLPVFWRLSLLLKDLECIRR